MRQISKQLTEAILNDVTVNWKLGKRSLENDPRYIESEVIQLPDLLAALSKIFFSIESKFEVW